MVTHQRPWVEFYYLLAVMKATNDSRLVHSPAHSHGTEYMKHAIVLVGALTMHPLPLVTW